MVSKQALFRSSANEVGSFILCYLMFMVMNSCSTFSLHLSFCRDDVIFNLTVYDLEWDPALIEPWLESPVFPKTVVDVMGDPGFEVALKDVPVCAGKESCNCVTTGWCCRPGTCGVSVPWWRSMKRTLWSVRPSGGSAQETYASVIFP